MKISIGETLGISVLGILVVFAVLVLLMAIIYLLSGLLKRTVKTPKAAPAAEAAPEAAPLPARGSCGQVKLFDVPDRTAAMVMAIVADELGVPLNELRFISIKEIDE